MGTGFRPDLHLTLIICFHLPSVPIDLHSVVAVFPSRTKRPRLFDDLLQASQSKLAKNPPPEIGIPSNYGSLQRKLAERILDYRPTSDLTSPPPFPSSTTALVSSWISFTVARRHGPAVPWSGDEHSSKEQQGLKGAVDFFAEQMTQIYGNEESRRTDGSFGATPPIGLSPLVHP